MFLAVVNFSLISQEHSTRTCTRIVPPWGGVSFLPLMSVIHWLLSIPLQKWRRAPSVFHSSGKSLKMEGGSESVLRSQHSPQQGDGCDTDQGSWPFAINRHWLQARQEVQVRLYWDPWCSSGEQEQTAASLACLLPGWWQAFPSYLPRGQECVQGLGSRGGSGSFAHPSGDIDCRGACAVPGFFCQHPVFAPGSSKAAAGLFWSFCIFWFRICPNCSMHWYFQSHIVSLYFVARADVCPAASRAAKGPRPQPVLDAPVL